MFERTGFFFILVAIAIFTSGWGVEGAHASVLERMSGGERYSLPVVNRTLGLENGGTKVLNEACLRSRVTRVDFRGIDQLKDFTNYCQLEVNALPNDVLALIEKIGDLNNQVAGVLGQDPGATFTMPIEVTVSADGRGSLASEAQGGRIFLTTWPDWKFTDFSPEIYAHEIIHVLMFNSGSTSNAFVGLRDHPFLIEALPDLISATIHDSPQLKAGEDGLPECLRVIRDGSPTRSLDEPFSHFYKFASIDRGNQCCATLDLEKVSPLAKTICAQYSWAKPAKMAENELFVQENGTIEKALTETNLSAPFQASDCRVTTKTDLVYLDGCDTHQFAYPLVSFFFRVKELIGKSYVTAFIAKIRDAAKTSGVYECGYAGGTKMLGGAKVLIPLRPLLGAFNALRESLPSAEQVAFDQAWNEHAFGKMVDLDRLYRNETLPGIAQAAVKAKNTLYRDAHDCGNPYNLDPVACQVVCEKKL